MAKCKVFLLGRDYIPHKLNCVNNDINTVIATFQSYNYITYHSKANDKLELVQELEKFICDLEKNDIFIFYYAGHAKTNENYYLYIDNNEIDFDSFIYKTIKENKSIKNVLFVIDACMSAKILKSFQILKDSFCAFVSSSYTDKSYEMTDVDAQQINTSIPLGFFTHFFTKSIDKLLSLNEKVSIQGLGDSIEKDIKEYNKNFNKDIPSPQIQVTNNNFSINKNNLDYEKLQKLQKCQYSYPDNIQVFEEKDFFINFLTYLHEGFEHTIIEIEQEIKNKQISTNKEKLRLLIGDLLYKIKEIFLHCTLDVSVHIKLIHKMDNDNNIYLKAFCRVPSEYETNQKLKIRTQEESFILNYEQEINEIKILAEKDEIKVNSAYNQAFMNNYWICNNLISAETNDCFYSNSKDYKNYYNSLAVFSIYNKDEKIFLDDIKGLLIIDSIESGCFDSDFMKQLGGYFTHRINRLLSLNIFNLLFENKA